MADFYLVYLASKGAIFLSLLYKISPKFQCKMTILCRLCFAIAFCTLFQFYKRVFVFQLIFLGFLVMDCGSKLKLLLSDFGCGVLVFGCFSKILNVLVLLILLILGFFYLQYSGVCDKFRGKLFDLSKKRKRGFCLMCSSSKKTDEVGVVKELTFDGGTTRMLEKKVSECGDHHKFEEINEVVRSNYGVHDCVVVGGNGEESISEEFCNEDQVFDVITLRKMVKVQKERANMVSSELEKERNAASSAVDEAMAMILRLQNEKSVLQMEISQLQRVSENKQLHDQEVIQSLQWIVMKHESERSILEDQLRLCREKLKVFVKGEEWDHFDCVCPTPSAFSSFESRVDDLPVGVLDFESSPL